MEVKMRRNFEYICIYAFENYALNYVCTKIPYYMFIREWRWQIWSSNFSFGNYQTSILARRNAEILRIGIFGQKLIGRVIDVQKWIKHRNFIKKSNFSKKKNSVSLSCRNLCLITQKYGQILLFRIESTSFLIQQKNVDLNKIPQSSRCVFGPTLAPLF